MQIFFFFFIIFFFNISVHSSLVLFVNPYEKKRVFFNTLYLNYEVKIVYI